MSLIPRKGQKGLAGLASLASLAFLPSFSFWLAASGKVVLSYVIVTLYGDLDFCLVLWNPYLRHSHIFEFP